MPSSNLAVASSLLLLQDDISPAPARTALPELVVAVGAGVLVRVGDGPEVGVRVGVFGDAGVAVGVFALALNVITNCGRLVASREAKITSSLLSPTSTKL